MHTDTFFKELIGIKKVDNMQYEQFINDLTASGRIAYNLTMIQTLKLFEMYIGEQTKPLEDRLSLERLIYAMEE